MNKADTADAVALFDHHGIKDFNVLKELNSYAGRLNAGLLKDSKIKSNLRIVWSQPEPVPTLRTQG